MNLAVKTKKTPVALLVAVGAAALITGCTVAGQATGTSSATPAATGAPASGAPASAATPSGTATATGSPGATPPAGASGGPHATPAAQGVPSCQASGLKLTRGVSGAAAGSTYTQILLTNTSGVTCTLYGYPGVALTTSTATGSQVGAAATRSASRSATLVTLAPGATAAAQLQLVDVLNYPAANCEPTSASYLQVYPPGQTMALYLPFAAQACRKPIFTLGIGPVYAQTGA